MRHPSRRQQRLELNEQKVARRRVARQLRQQLAAQGLQRRPTSTIANATSEWKTVDEERQARQEAVEEHLRIYRSVLPVLLRRFAKIRDPRNPKTSKHKLTVVMLYGILSFVFQMASRREANRQMTMPMFQENLRLMFPELEKLPHQDTLNRLLSKIEVDEIEDTLLELIERFVRQKKFCRYLVSKCYPVAIDGTQKLVRNICWDEQCLEREVQHKESDGSVTARPQYYIYVLEASLAFADGMTIPLMSEFLSYEEGNWERNKQDCELKAFQRLAERIKQRFPRLPLMVLLDGLYANGPVLELCRRKGWQFMIVLQDGSLPSVWEEVEGLKKLQPRNRLERNWGDRKQHFWWVNDIEYRYGDHERKRQNAHVVICEESWAEVDAATTQIVIKRSKHAWLSSEPLSRENVHERCNLGGRHRWGIENNFLVEKHHGYQYEHCFSQNWNAMKGYHWLMRLGHLINILARNTAKLARLVRRMGVRGLIGLLRETCSGPWLDQDRIRVVLLSPCQIRLE
jgi:hypothetical protein